MDTDCAKTLQNETKRIAVDLEPDQVAWVYAQAENCKLKPAQYIRMRLAQLQAAEVGA